MQRGCLELKLLLSCYRANESPCPNSNMASTLISCSVLIGIPSFRRPDGLGKLLDSLAQQTNVDQQSITVFVADNDPQLRDASRICSVIAPHFRWALRSAVVEEPGVAAARNRILAEARRCGQDLIAMLDDDQIATPGWLSQLLSMQQMTGADAVGGPVSYRFPVQPSRAVRRWGYFNPRPQDAGPVSLLSGAGNVLLTCAGLKRLHWPHFDVRFGTSGGEDAEFFMRLAAKGFRFAWAPKAIVHEEVAADRLSGKALISRAYRTGNNEVRICSVNNKPNTITMMIGKAAALLIAAPLLAPLLLSPYRLWLLSKWASSIGRMAAILGRTSYYYGNADRVPPR